MISSYLSIWGMIIRLNFRKLISRSSVWYSESLLFNIVNCEVFRLIFGSIRSVIINKPRIIHFTFKWPLLLQVSSHAVLHFFNTRVIGGLFNRFKVHHAFLALVVDSRLALMHYLWSWSFSKFPRFKVRVLSKELILMIFLLPHFVIVWSAWLRVYPCRRSIFLVFLN